MTEENENVEQSKTEPGFAIEGNVVVFHLTKASFGLDLQPQKKSKVSTWGSFESNGLLPVAFEMLDDDFQVLGDGVHALSEQGLKNLLGRIAGLGVAGTKTAYNEMLRREDDIVVKDNF